MATLRIEPAEEDLDGFCHRVGAWAATYVPAYSDLLPAALARDLAVGNHQAADTTPLARPAA